MALLTRTAPKTLPRLQDDPAFLAADERVANFTHRTAEARGRRDRELARVAAARPSSPDYAVLQQRAGAAAAEVADLEVELRAAREARGAAIEAASARLLRDCATEDSRLLHTVAETAVAFWLAFDAARSFRQELASRGFIVRAGLPEVRLPNALELRSLASITGATGAEPLGGNLLPRMLERFAELGIDVPSVSAALADADTFRQQLAAR